MNLKINIEKVYKENRTEKALKLKTGILDLTMKVEELLKYKYDSEEETKLEDKVTWRINQMDSNTNM